MHNHTPAPLSPDTDDDAFDEDFYSLSWSIEPGPVAIKKTDRPVFLYRETVIPEKIRPFFSLDDLQPGRKRGIVFWLDDQRFDAFIEKTHHFIPRTRMLWKQDFAEVLHAACPKWLEFFKKSRGESDDTPSLFFTQRPEQDHYDVAFEGALSPGAIPAEFHVPLKPGDTIENDTLRAVFSCGLSGNTRRSLKTSSVVLVADHTCSPYEDTWVNNFFHYTGRGLGGKQGLSLPENKILVESKINGVSLYLFEVFIEGHYVYMGEVELADKPFLSRQTDSEKNIRDVYIFPLKLVGQKRPPLRYRELQETKEELARRAAHPQGTEDESPAPYSMKGRRMHNAPEKDLKSAQCKTKGICQLCNQPAPFCNKNGEPYLETHHIHSRSQGGDDTSENTVSLCPNCHRKMHILNLPADVAKLKNLHSPRA
jgi:5-methylcytosine-specific restriction protein A